MSIKFKCRHCFRKVGAPDEMRGEGVNCPACDRKIQVPSPTFGTGTQIDNFVVEQWLGSGAMGEVHLARQEPMNRQVALKIMTMGAQVEEDDKQRFVREIQTMAQLSHPNIVQAIAAGQFDGGSYLVMNYVDGETMDDKIQKAGKIHWKEALNFILPVADALNYSWGKLKIIHRDIKPDNIMIDSDNHVHLTDMGIAKSADSDVDITAPGVVMGTPFYMSPEQAAGEDLDFRCDIYGLGAALYHMVTGTPPYAGGTSMQIMSKKLREKPQPPKELNADIPDKVCSLIDKLMAIQPEARPASWEKAIELINKTLNGEPAKKKKKIKAATPAATPSAPAEKAAKKPASRKAKAPEKKSNNGIFIAVGAVVLIAVIAAVALSGN